MTDLGPEFYNQQIEMMKSRYSIVFEGWGIKWDRYIEDVEAKLHGKKYWIWCFLVGLEKFIQKYGHRSALSKLLEKDKEFRVRKIIGDFFQVQNYVRNL
jgi:hypothetical protein